MVGKHAQSLIQQTLSLQDKQDYAQPKNKKPKIKKSLSNEILKQEATLDEKTSQRILALVSKQQLALAEEQDEQDEQENINIDRNAQTTIPPAEDSDSEFSDNDIDPNDCQNDIDIDVSDRILLEKLSNATPNLVLHLNPQDSNLAIVSSAEMASHSDIHPRIVAVYTKLGLLLKRYTSGRLPKAFRALPSLPQWPQILELTSPETWTPHATLIATRMFVSSMDSRNAARFVHSILLPSVRRDIQSTGKLNCHLYHALKKSLYKPAAFFKGLLIPLCVPGGCTLREAAIIASVLVKVSVPMLHSAAALLKLAEMEYSGPTSLFIRILLDKKYALPYRVIDSLVFHYMRFNTLNQAIVESLPVLWHQSLLIFAQRYKQDLTPEQKEGLMSVVKVRAHREISPEIVRELVNSVCRGEEVVGVTAQGNEDGMDMVY